MTKKTTELTFAEASELVSQIIPNIVADPETDRVAHALMRLLDRLVRLGTESLENNEAVLQQAIFHRTDAFCWAVDEFSKTGAVGRSRGETLPA